MKEKVLQKWINVRNEAADTYNALRYTLTPAQRTDSLRLISILDKVIEDIKLIEP